MLNAPAARGADSMQKTLRKIAKLPLTAAMRLPFIRKRAAHHFRMDYYPDLEVSIPLGNGLWCPVLDRNSIHSFGEIFVEREYGEALDAIPPPRRWVDLGCHAGYFSLYLAWRLAGAGAADGAARDWRALLVDADPRMEPLARGALDMNGFSRNYTFRAGLVSKGAGEREFALRDGMTSSTDVQANGANAVRKIPVLTPGEMLAAFPPPYDLIKVDIEGGEADFVECYKDVYTQSAAILMEWHSKDAKGAAAGPLRAGLEAAGFAFAGEVRAMRVHHLDIGPVSSGVQLYRRA